MKNIDKIEISSIKDSKFLKTLSLDSLNVLCEDLRNEVLSKVSQNGGHLSSNLGIVETTVALHKVFNFPQDKIIFDVGHQCYVHKILSGRSLSNLGCEEGTARFQKISESEYDCFEAGHSSTSISAAEGFAIARDANNENYDIVAVIGDASIVNGLSLEALNNVGISNHKIIIVLNDNDMSISQPKGNLSNYFRKISSGKLYNSIKRKYKKKLNSGSKLYNTLAKTRDFFRHILIRNETIFENLGLSYIGPVDGHDIKALEKAFNRAKNTTKSTIVHVRTIKGKGYKYSETDKVGYWHGVTPFDIETGKPKNLHDGLISWSHIFSDLTNEMMTLNKNSYLIVPATLKGSGLENCFASYPGRCIDVGIAEEHALTLAGSLSLNNIHPIVTIYSTFLQRAYDELSHDCARFNKGLTLLIDRAGLVGKDGETHQGIYDVAFLKSIPNITITMPTNKNEAKQLYLDSFDNYGVFAIRYPRDYEVINSDYNKVSLPYGRFKFENVSTNKQLAIVGVGPNSRKLFNQLNSDNIDVTYANAIYLNPISNHDIETLSEYKNILIYDSYSIEEGFAESLKSKLVDSLFKGNVITKCIKTEFVKQGSIEDQLKRYSLDIDSMVKTVKEIAK